MAAPQRVAGRRRPLGRLAFSPLVPLPMAREVELEPRCVLAVSVGLSLTETVEVALWGLEWFLVFLSAAPSWDAAADGAMASSLTVQHWVTRSVLMRRPHGHVSWHWGSLGAGGTIGFLDFGGSERGFGGVQRRHSCALGGSRRARRGSRSMEHGRPVGALLPWCRRCSTRVV